MSGTISDYHRERSKNWTARTIVSADSAGFLHASHWPTVLDPHPDRKVITVDVERDLDILRMQV
jgi:hypothetical protein